jgi:Protein of unknown function (DUF3775)
MRLSEVIGEAIRLARSIPRQQYGSPNEHGFVVIRASDLPPPSPPSSEEQRLTQFLLSQPAAVIYATAVLMYLGRGDFEDEPDFLEAYTHLSDIGAPAETVRHITQKLPFADYLEDGLAQAAKLGIDVDGLLED